MEYLAIFLSEIFGTFVLILMGCSVNANVNLKKTYGSGSGWIVITFGWSMAVFCGATVAWISGGHLNPAVTIAVWIEGSITFLQALTYLAGEFVGGFLGALTVAMIFWDHFKATDNKGAIAGTFYTAPASKNIVKNFLTEAIATFVLIFVILTSAEYASPAFLGPWIAALTVLGIGLCLGGLTGYAINPTRDLMPRLVHTIIKIPNKGSSNWNYSWIPAIAPIVGSLIAVGAYELLLVVA